MMGGRSLFIFSIATWLCAAFATPLRTATAGELPRNFVLHDTPKPVAQDVSFSDAEGHVHSLADRKAKTLLLNIWATWCVPCRNEMPALDRLQASMGGADFEVFPVSIDRGGIDAVRKFYTDIGIRNLAMYVDQSGQVLRQFGAIGLPTTLLIDRGGREIGRVIGPAEWDSPEIAEFLKPIITNRIEIAAQTSKANAIVVEQPWARATPGRSKTGAAYVTLVNKGNSVDRLLGATTPLAEQVQFHNETQDGGISRMREVHNIDINPGAKIVFKPGDLHIMMVGLKQQLIQGQSFPLTFQFEKAGNIEVTVPIEGIGAMQHEDMGTMMHMPDDGMKK